jgi:hypothetical protein
MHAKRITRILIVKDKDVIGLDDCISGDRYAFSVELVSTKGELYRIKRNVRKNLTA